MITINSRTRIAALLKAHPGSLEAIISLSPAFEKLRNPVLRRLMAGRATIGMASKIGGCTVQAFFDQLRPLGFTVAEDQQPDIQEQQQEAPEVIRNLPPGMMTELDVRPVIAAGKDPLDLILEKVKPLKPGQALKLINSFEPAPLIRLLERQGFKAYIDTVSYQLVITYFLLQSGHDVAEPDTTKAEEGWDERLQEYSGRLETIDVRQMEMPQPMFLILDALDKLPEDHALFVYHKRIPVFLLPELATRKFDFRIKTIKDDEVHLLIYKS